MLIRIWKSTGRDCPQNPETPFTDIVDDSPHAEDIACLHALGITTGTTATTYSPELSFTRAQSASMLIRIWKSTGRDCPQNPETPFTDIVDDSPHAEDIACLHALGTTTGTTATTYSPELSFTRAQLATLAIRLYNATNP